MQPYSSVRVAQVQATGNFGQGIPFNEKPDGAIIPRQTMLEITWLTSSLTERRLEKRP